MKKIKCKKERIRNNKILKLCVSLVLIVVIIFKVGSVSAGTNDSVMTKNRMDGVYAIATVDGRERIFYLNMYRMNDRVSYCIELGKDVTTNLYHSTNDFSVSYLSSEQNEYIRSISYFGYEYLGHDDYHYYMAAQELIWEYLSNINVEWTNVLDVNGPRIDIEFYKQEILNKRDDYYREISLLDWINGQIYSQGEVYEYLDMESVISEYEIVSKGHYQANIYDNKLHIEFANGYIGEDSIILRRKNYYDYWGSLYYYDNSQKLISNGNYINIETVLSFEIVGDEMRGQIINPDMVCDFREDEASLVGAVYDVFDSKHRFVGRYETDLCGTFFATDLRYGKYYIKHVKPSCGYLLYDKEFEFYFSEENKEVSLVQEIITNDIEINKVYGNNGEYVPEEGIIFEFVDLLGDRYYSVVTNENGVASVRLPYGSYRVVQSNTSWGYYMVSPFEVEVRDFKSDKVIYNLVNERIECRIRINTSDAIHGNGIGGIVYRIKEKGSNDYLSFDGKGDFVTDSNGMLELPMLFSYGDYILEQIDVSNNFLVNDEVLEILINDETSFFIEDNQLWININIVNQPVKGKVELTYNEEVFYSEINNYDYEIIPRTDSKFVFVANEDIIFNQNLIHKAGDVIDEFVTDSNGMFIIKNVYLGKYCLINVDDSEETCFEISSDSNKVDVVEKKIEVTKYLNKGDIKLISKDELGNVLEGNVFELFDSNGQVIFTGSTNSDGIIIIKDLVFGDYCISQKNVLEKYELIEGKRCITFNDNELIEFINKIKVNKIVVPDTFLESGINFKFWIHVLVLVGIGVFIYKKVIINR